MPHDATKNNNNNNEAGLSTVLDPRIPRAKNKMKVTPKSISETVEHRGQRKFQKQQSEDWLLPRRKIDSYLISSNIGRQMKWEQYLQN